MSIYKLMAVIFALGGAGGFINCILTGARKVLPGYDEAGSWHPGWLGNSVLGAVAALLIWGLYGASASFDLLGDESFKGHLTLAQLMIAVVIGMGGSRILTLEVQKIILRSERDAERNAKDRLSLATEALLNKTKEGEKDA